MGHVVAGGVVPGRAVRVVVPGSTANLGPAYDCAGLALGVHDDVVVTAGEPGGPLRVSVEGPGSDALPQGEGPGAEDHLVVRSLRAALHAWGVGDAEQPGLVLSARNGVPLGRGVGSSAAAVVTGVVAAAALVERAPSLEEQLHVAAALEGHPDNAAASLLGGLTLGWSGPDRRWRAVRVEPHPDLDVLLCVPDEALSTARARAMLPLQVDHDDAAHNAGRSALLVEALTRSPHLLVEATRDRLHQRHRSAAMPGASALLSALREAGHAAVVSGAGPSLLVLHAGGREQQRSAVLEVVAEVVAGLPGGLGWRVDAPGIERAGAVASTPAAPW